MLRCHLHLQVGSSEAIGEGRRRTAHHKGDPGSFQQHQQPKCSKRTMGSHVWNFGQGLQEPRRENWPLQLPQALRVGPKEVQGRGSLSRLHRLPSVGNTGTVYFAQISLSFDEVYSVSRFLANLGWLTCRFEEFPSWWAVPVDTYYLSRVKEHPRLKSTQPRCVRR